MEPAPARLGRYELVTHLATGGMGRVSLGRARGEGGFERHVVIKSLDLVEIDDTEATEMFLDEARLLGMLHHQHVAAIHEVGRDEDGRLFLVLEYVHGHSAHDVWERALDLSIQLPLDFTLTLIAAAASGLHYAHTKRSPDGERLHLVHRDVTLSNVMVGFDGAIKVIDFGIAKAALRTTRTQAGFIKGKLGYMAPEQLRGQKLDARTDVFALGIVLYELTTMQRAFREASDRATVERIKAGTYARPSQIVPDYPPELEAIVARALKTDPAARFESADELRRAIEALAHELHLVLGDGAVVDVMAKLFTDRAEPWQRRATTRAETESSIEVEWADPHVATTRVAPHAALASLLAPTVEDAPPSRPDTESADLLVIATEEASGIGLPRLATSPAELARAASADPGVPTRVITESSGELISPPASSGSEPADLDDLISEISAAPSSAVASRPAPASATDERVKSTAFIKVPGRRKRSRWPVVGAVIAVAVAVAVPVVLIATREDAVAGQPAPAASPATGTRAVTPPAAPARADATPARPSAPAPADTPTSRAGTSPPAAPTSPPTAPAVASPATIHIRVTSTPADATVLLDQRRLGHTPFEGELALAPGPHTLKVRLRGYAAQKRTIDLAAGAGVDETFSLARTTADATPGVADN